MIEISDIRFRIGTFSMEGVSLSVRAREYFVLVGKPGSGKTILMECVAGLKRVDSGTITIAGRDVTCMEPRLRRIGYVPQDLAIFPHLTVRRNIAFGLKTLGLDGREIAVRVRHIAELLGIEHLLERTTEGLSGGERQRVALARALAPRPPVLLLDEPLSALDEETRSGLYAEMKRVQRETGTTVLHICHDLEEMSALADRVAIMRHGRIVQVGTPDEISHEPADSEVANFLRLGTVLRGKAMSDADAAIIELEDGSVVRARGKGAGAVAFLVRSDGVTISRGMPSGNDINVFEGRLISVLRTGPVVFADAEIGKFTLRAAMPPLAAEPLAGLESGAPVRISFPYSAVYIFRENSEDGTQAARTEAAT